MHFTIGRLYEKIDRLKKLSDAVSKKSYELGCINTQDEEVSNIYRLISEIDQLIKELGLEIEEDFDE